MILLIPLIILSCTMLIFQGIIGGDNIQAMKSIQLSAEYLEAIKNIAEQNQLEFIRLLTKAASVAGFNVEGLSDEAVEEILSQYNSPFDSFQETLYEIYNKSYSAVKISPIPRQSKGITKVKDIESGEWYEIEQTRSWIYTHYDDFGADRTYGGERRHLGNDIMAELNTPIVSMTDGEISQIGWNELGGWRLGITDLNGTYWYYAHMNRYEIGMQLGKQIQAGEVIGYVGSSGYGSEGTTGKFADHLHLQIGIVMNDSKEYTWINPYPIVVFMEANRVSLSKE